MKDSKASSRRESTSKKSNGSDKKSVDENLYQLSDQSMFNTEDIINKKHV